MTKCKTCGSPFERRAPAHKFCTPECRPSASRAYEEAPEVYVMRLARAAAARRGLPCSVTPADIEIPDFCPGTGEAIAVRGTEDLRRPGGQWGSAAVMLRDPALGFVPGNVAVVSRLATRTWRRRPEVRRALIRAGFVL